jgi:putative PIN family toxin of toxin-antitoxin system
MIRVVIDTNVVASGTYWAGDSSKVIELIDDGIIIGILSEDILKEYHRTLNRADILEKIDDIQFRRKAVIGKIFEKMVIVKPNLKIKKSVDPDDDKFLEAAIEGKADYIVSRDHHLLDLKEYQKIKIVTPEKFLKIIQPK